MSIIPRTRSIGILSLLLFLRLSTANMKTKINICIFIETSRLFSFIIFLTCCIYYVFIWYTFILQATYKISNGRKSSLLRENVTQIIIMRSSSLVTYYTCNNILIYYITTSDKPKFRRNIKRPFQNTTYKLNYGYKFITVNYFQ